MGALIIKHLEGKDDRGTIEVIKENPYMQYFLGFEHFHFEAIFDASLFVHIRKRLGKESFDKMNQLIIAQAIKLEEKSKIASKKKHLKPMNFKMIVTSENCRWMQRFVRPILNFQQM